MAEVKWIKIVTDIFDDEKILLIESMPEADAIIVIWFKLLCLAGKNNNSGVFMLNDRIPYTDEMLATIFRRKLNTVRLALKTFETYGMVEIVDGAITVPNWSKHQTLDRIEERKEYMRKYMADRREKQKQIACKVNSKVNSKVNVNPLEEDIEEDIDIDTTPKPPKGIDARFKKFWESYPRKVGKGAAEKSFKKYKPDDALLATMLKAITEQKQSDQWKKDGGQFIPNPSTWLNQKRWEDEIPEPKPPKQNKSAETGSNSSLDMDMIHERLHRGAV